MKKLKTLNDLPNLDDIGSGSILNLKKVIKQDNSLLVPAKEQESVKIKKGYVWMIKDKTSKLVHPDKVQENINNGFRLTKKK